MTKKIKRMTPAILRTRLSLIRDTINARNYGEAEELIDRVMECMDKYDWVKLREIENAETIKF